MYPLCHYTKQIENKICEGATIFQFDGAYHTKKLSLALKIDQKNPGVNKKWGLISTPFHYAGKQPSFIVKGSLDVTMASLLAPISQG